MLDVSHVHVFSCFGIDVSYVSDMRIVCFLLHERADHIILL